MRRTGAKGRRVYDPVAVLPDGLVSAPITWGALKRLPATRPRACLTNFLTSSQSSRHGRPLHNEATLRSNGHFFGLEQSVVLLSWGLLS